MSSQQVGPGMPSMTGPQAATSPPGYVMPQLQPGQVIIIQSTGSTGPRVYENYAARTSWFLGISRICIGVLSILLAIAAIVVDSVLSYGIQTVSPSGAGIWCGGFFILAGSFGIAAAKKKTMCLIVTNMVLAIVSVSIFGMTYLGVSAAGIPMAKELSGYYYYYGREDTAGKSAGLIALFSLMLVLAVAQCVCDIWSSVICCKAVCCGHSASPPMQVLQTQPGQQVIYLNNPQMGTQQAAVPYSPTGPSYQYPSTQAQASAPTRGGDSPPPAYGVGTNQEKQTPLAFVN